MVVVGTHFSTIFAACGLVDISPTERLKLKFLLPQTQRPPGLWSSSAFSGARLQALSAGSMGAGSGLFLSGPRFGPSPEV